MAKLAEENNNVNAIKNVVELNDLTTLNGGMGLRLGTLQHRVEMW